MKTVREIMQTGVVTVAPEATVTELAQLLYERGISGAPVCDGGGKVLGVVSATDLVRLAAEDGALVAVEEAWPADPGLRDDFEDEEDDELAPYFLDADVGAYDWAGAGAEPAVFDRYTVRDIMTRATFSVRPRATIAELARFLLRARIHRALVLEDGRLTGIVTTSDVLRAVAEAAESAGALTGDVVPA